MSDGIFTACGLSEQSPNPTPFVGRELFFYHESMIFVTQHLTYLIINVFFCQKSRLGALESLRTSNSRSIVVASDVAARGLDIQAVTTVVHYDVARSVDTFIHRAGRTAVSLYSWG